MALSGKKKLSVGNLQEFLKFVGGKAAEEFETLLKENIRTNKFGFALSEVKVDKKFEENSTTPLISQEEYITSIVREKSRVAVTKGKHAGSGLTFEELTYILEHGRRDKGIMSTPVWRETLQEYKPRFAKLVKEEFLKRFYIVKVKL